MNKVTTINLAGNAYQLEEPGYEKLHAYMSDAKAKLGTNPDADEIILDLERAIAEKCIVYLSHGKTVVSASEVEQIIKDMGPVHAEENSEQASAAHAAPADSTKRLYRIRQDAWILGVCSGLAAYLDINVAAIRIMAIILLFATHGAMIAVYIITALFIPRADTPEKRAAAHGVPFSTQEFIARAYELSDEVKASSREWKRYRRAMKRDYKRKKYEGTREGWWLIGPIFGALSLLWVFALLSVITTHALFGFALPATMPLWLAIVILAVIYSAVISPIRHIAYLHTHPVDWNKNWQHQGPPGPLGFLFQVLSIWFLGWLLYTYVPAAHDFMNMVWMQVQQASWLQ